MLEYDNWKENYINLVAENGKVDVLNLIPEDKRPKILYKFVSLSSKGDNEYDKKKIASLINNELYLASILTFNDPYECNLNIDISEQMHAGIEIEAYKYGKNRQMRREVVKVKRKFEKEISIELTKLNGDWSNFRKNIVVSCLTAEEKSFLMWGHYTNSYHGFCIGYDFLHLINSIKSSTSRISPVRYSNELTAIKKIVDDNEMIPIGICATVTKSTQWKYENEWRIIDHVKEKEKIIQSPAPISLYFGMNINQTIRTDLIKFARKINIRNICDVKLAKDRYELIFKPV
jgi:hypothetical protein